MRHIVRIDIKNNALVKGVNLEGLRVLGDPIEAAKYYSQQGCEELFIVDVVASLYGRNALEDLILTISENVFVPVTVAGGIRSERDVEVLLKAGADRVAVNSAFVQNISLASKLSREFGSSTICGMIEGVRISNSDIHCYTDSGREETQIDLFEWAHRLESEGVGEIIYTDVAAEGTGRGIDVNTVGQLSSIINIPLVINGGVGQKSDVAQARGIDKLSGVSVASCIHFNYLEEIKGGDHILGNSEMRSSLKVPSFIRPFSLSEYNASGMS